MSRLVCIVAALGLSAWMATLHGYLIAIGLMCLAAALALFIVPSDRQTPGRLRMGHGFIAAAAAFLMLQLVTLMLAYRAS